MYECPSPEGVMQDLSGTRIDRYSIEAEIGRGGMSRVYRAHDSGLGRDVALKVLLPEITGDEASVTRFLREARAAAKLDHPNIVPIYDTGQDNGSYFIAMKLIEGRTLRAVLGERVLSLTEAADYLRQIASALDFAHQRGIVHRDIKPENIMLDAAGTATLTDFGIANLADETSVTRTGAVVGTPVYMAPEHLRGEVATARSDIYGLGVLAYELLSGAPPFAGRAPYAVMLAQIDEQPEPVHKRRNDVPLEASRVIDRALEKDPAQRQATPGEFVRQFTDALGERRGLPPVAIAMPGKRLSGTSAVTISSSVSPLAGRVTAAPTQVSGAAVDASASGPVWRGPWFMSLLGAGLLVAVMVAGVSAFRGSPDTISGEEDPAFLPLAGTPTHEPAPENTTEPEVVTPVAQPERDEPSEEERRPATPAPANTPEPTATVVDQIPAEPEPAEAVEEAPPVEPVPNEVVEEQPAVAPDEEGEEDEGGPPANPGNNPEQQDKEKPDNSSQDNKHDDEKDKEEKEKDKDD